MGGAAGGAVPVPADQRSSRGRSYPPSSAGHTSRPTPRPRTNVRLAERELTETAVAALPDLAAEHGISDEVHDRLTRDYHEHLELVDARTPRGTDPLNDGAEAAVEKETTRVLEDSPLRRDEEYTRLRLAVLDRKREVLIRLRHEGVVDDSIARHLQTRLDIEELRLTGVEPLD